MNLALAAGLAPPLLIKCIYSQRKLLSAFTQTTIWGKIGAHFLDLASAVLLSLHINTL